MVVVCFFWFYFVCSYYMAQGEAKPWERVCRRQLLLDKPYFRSIHSVPPPQCLKSSLELQLYSCVDYNKVVVCG